MKFRSLVALSLLLVPAASARKLGEMSDDELGSNFSAQVKKTRPDLPAADLHRNFMVTLPEARRTLSQRSCAGGPCSKGAINSAIFDTYLSTLERKGYISVTIGDVNSTISDSSYVGVWSDPQEADFKLLLGGTAKWSDKTNNDTFITRADYTIHIELKGYEPFDGPCSNKVRDGVRCGATLKKKP